MKRAGLRAALIGLDGATFKVITPLVAVGKLPNIARLISEGCSGVLTSITPPMTGPAWAVLATGRSPGQLGLFDYSNRRSLNGYRLYPIRSGDIAGRAFWDVLGAAGYRVGVLNYPMLVPAYPINGWMVAGLGASKLQQFTYPAELRQRLDQATNGYEINLSYMLPQYRDNIPQLVADMKSCLRKRLLALDYLLEEHPVDVLVSVFMVSDVALHTLWCYWPPTDGDAVDPLASEMREEFVSIWQELDRAVGHILQHLAPDGHILVVSDHGFGRSHGVFHANRWLEQEGYLAYRAISRSNGNRTREWLASIAMPLARPISILMWGSRMQQALRPSVLREIDLKNSKAFAPDNSHGWIFINREYARLRGIDEEQFVNSTAEEIRERLLAWSKEQELQLDALLASELYSGEKSSLAPELWISVNGGACSVISNREAPVYMARRQHSVKSGTHRIDGIVVAAGPGIRPSRVIGARLADVAPTLLHILGAPIDPAMDGRVLVGAPMPRCRGTEEPSQGVPAPIGVGRESER